jgi:two-component system sensor histidine kinase HydH
LFALYPFVYLLDLDNRVKGLHTISVEKPTTHNTNLDSPQKRVSFHTNSLQIAKEKIRQIESAGEIEVDQDRPQRAVDNVCLNAAQSMIEVQARLRNDRLELNFTGNAPGLPGEVIASVFEPMFSTKSFGVGLGLSIVQNIMTDHGGGVKLDSTIGKGTTVTFWLPVS